MRLPFHPTAALVATFSVFLSLASAEQLVKSNSLNSCQANSGFTATLFDVIFTPANRSLAFNVVGVSSISGNVTAEIQFIAYGYTALRFHVDPCQSKDFGGLCPMNTGQINIDSNVPLSQSVIDHIPSIAYGVPDLDGKVRVYINSTATGESVACVEAELSNGKSVYHKAVGWVTAVIAGLALLASAVTSGLGHSNTAAHVAANALSLFAFFQAQAMIGMTAVVLPPIVQSWTQNFQWSMGIIRVGFMQSICTWYQRSTGGTPATLLTTLATKSVQVQKRSLEYAARIAEHTADALAKRSNGPVVQKVAVLQVRGIDRVGFRAGIESTNIFMTGLIFFMIFVVIVAICVALFKVLCEALVRAGKLKGEKFQDFRNGWRVVLKGILFRLVLIGYPQMCVLSMWELTQRDSAAEVVLAIFFLVSMTFSLLWAALKVIRIAKRSVSMHKNPAYILYSDPKALNKWGFLYVQFRATAYYFVLPSLVYIFVKAAFIGFGQPSGNAQAIGLVVIETTYLVVVCWIRPWMDKKTNTFNISIAAINFVDVWFLLVFTTLFGQPPIVTGVMGVVFFGLNALFALLLLLMLLFASVYAIVAKNPDNRYQPMRDDRGSFIKSQTKLNTELDALGVTARGNMKTSYKTRDLDEDEDSYSSGSQRQQPNGSGNVLQPSTTDLARDAYRDPPRSPIDQSMPFIPSDGTPRHGPPHYADSPGRVFEDRSNSVSPAPRGYEYQPYKGGAASPSPWQRGAGYDR